MKRDLIRVKWLDDLTIRLGIQGHHPSIGLEKAEIISSFSSMLHGILYQKYPHAFPSIHSIIEFLIGNKKYIELSTSIAQLFLDRFNPKNPLSDDDFNQRSTALSNKIMSSIQVESACFLFNKMLESVHGTYRTNIYNDNRYALSLRVDPKILLPEPTDQQRLPFGVFFIHGRHFNAFHNRFRDIARGAVLIDFLRNSDQYAIESARHFNRVNEMAYFQQLKNKDIPEGGSNGLLLLNASGIEGESLFFNRISSSIKAFSDALLNCQRFC